ncbi:Fe3+ hydroxamate ABC transporter substrate-binding protein [Bacillus sp. BGMRC 2118]|nr:Fe3+ hydroxamate ABC transporter substrate-binding protein [Bacillus sp. BGMRC 2118]
MFKIIPKCSKCGKEIEGNEEVIVKLRYPDRRGMTEIRAFIQNEGQITCMKC